MKYLKTLIADLDFDLISLIVNARYQLFKYPTETRILPATSSDKYNLYASIAQLRQLEIKRPAAIQIDVPCEEKQTDGSLLFYVVSVFVNIDTGKPELPNVPPIILNADQYTDLVLKYKY